MCPDAVAHAREHTSRVVHVLADSLRAGPYLLGASFSAADILFVHCLNWGESIGWAAAWTDRADLCDYLARCRAREAYARAKARP